MIAFENVSKRYRALQALDGVSFEVNAGEVFGYLGPNGAGKTTSIKILTGLVRSYEGRVLAAGQDISRAGAEHHRIIGYLPQDAGFQEWRTVEHALGTFASLSGIPRGEREGRITEVLERLGIQEFRRSRIVHLSGGTVQKLRLAQALMHDPKILVLDEPLSGLDPASRHQVKGIIRELASPGRVIFFSSHILADVEDVATRIGILHRGTVRKVGTPRELREEYGLGNILEIQTADGSLPPDDVFPRGVVQRLERRGSETLLLHLDPARNLDESIRSVMRALVDRGVAVRSFRHLQPSLEDVYLRLTGGTE